MTRSIVKVFAGAVIFAAGSLSQAIAQDAGFDIVRFQEFEGNSILPADGFRNS